MANPKQADKQRILNLTVMRKGFLKPFFKRTANKKYKKTNKWIKTIEEVPLFNNEISRKVIYGLLIVPREQNRKEKRDFIKNMFNRKGRNARSQAEAVQPI